MQFRYYMGKIQKLDELIDNVSAYNIHFNKC